MTLVMFAPLTIDTFTGCGFLLKCGLVCLHWATAKGGKLFVKTAWKIGGILLVIVLLIGAGTLVLRRRMGAAGAESPAPTAAVTRGSIEETISATGNVSADQQATLTFGSSGQIAQVLVEEGQQVAAGDVLARLDTTSLEWQVTRAQASLNTAQARLVQAQKPASDADLASAQVALDSATSNYERVKAGPTAADQASAQAALDSARSNYQKVKAGPTKEDLAAAKATVDKARAALEQAQAAYDRIKDRPDVQMRQEALTLQSATIDLQQAQANYDATANHPTASELASAEAQVAQAEAQLAQLKDQPTASDLASAEAQVAQAEAQLTQLQQQPRSEDVAVFQAQVDEAQVALDQAQSQLDEAAIKAPFDGTVVNVQINQGDWANPGAPAIILATRLLTLDMNVDEVDVAALAKGQVAHFSFDALKGVTVDGAVTHIAPASTNVGGAVAYQVRVGFDPGAVPVRLGMTANVDVVVGRADDALLVPNRAITADREAGRYYVTRQRADGTTERLEVRIGLKGENETQILEGLSEGDRVVLPVLPAQDSGSGGPFGGGGAFGRQMSGGEQ
jgi:HlyD family secretion protein